MSRLLSKTTRRFRFDIKLKLIIKYKKKSNIFSRIRYFLFDPEIDTFSYNQLNSNQVAEILSKFLDKDIEEIQSYFEEGVKLKTTFQKLLLRTTIPRFLYMKLFLRIGRNINEYVLVRTLKPNYVVELGIKYGQGSILLLEALKKNHAEGSKGFLYCVDVDKSSGLFLKHSNKSYFSLINIDSVTFLERISLEGSVFIISDSVPNSNHIKNELIEARKKHSGFLLFQHNASWSQDVFSQDDAQCLIPQQCDHPIYPGRDVYIAKFMD